MVSTLPYYIPKAMPACDSPDPRRQTEDRLSELAKLVREHPTLPMAGITEDTLGDAMSPDKALVLPCKHCAFDSCSWTGDTDHELLEHLKAAHASEMRHAMDATSDQASTDEQVWAVYNHAVGQVCQQAAPTASYSIDRRALRSYTAAMSEDHVQEPICFCCARRFPHASSWGTKQHINWLRASLGAKTADAAEELPFEKFLGMSFEEANTILGLQTYLSRYGKCGDHSPDLTQQLHEFADWTVDVPFENGALTLLCCPEDRRCDRILCQDTTRICRACEIPVCVECQECLRGNAQMPPAALTNDMMVFYLPKELYVDKVTMMELLCASVCITTMVCFTLEAKYRKENPFDQQVHMARHRMGARGNVTSFPLPWQDLLRDLEQDSDKAPSLPRTGAELSDLVSVVLKTNEEASPDSMARFIHEARVRRSVVVKLITDAKARGHRAYTKVDLAAMRQKAQELPEDGVPPEIIKLLPHDNDLDKVMVQKAACPVVGRGDVEAAAVCMGRVKPNAVVMEKSGCDETDLNTERVAALRYLATRMGEPQQPVEMIRETNQRRRTRAKFGDWS